MALPRLAPENVNNESRPIMQGTLGLHSRDAGASPYNRVDGQEHWVGTWAASAQGPFYDHARRLVGLGQFDNLTVRQIVRTSIGGNRLRVRFSNTAGVQPLAIGTAHIGLRSFGAGVIPDSGRMLTCEGCPSLLVQPGGIVLSDPVDLKVPPLADLAVSIYSPSGLAGTAHVLGLQTTYISAHGDFADSEILPAARTIASWLGLSGIDLLSHKSTSAVVAFGDCTVDGANSTAEAYRRWPDVLARRLIAAGHNVAVLNSGIMGNRVLHDGPAPYGPIFGRKALSRFDQDVLAQPGVKYVIVALGGADIIQPGSSAPMSEDVTVKALIAGFQQLIAHAHDAGLRVFGCTIGPIEGAAQPGFRNMYSPVKEAKRQNLNEWIRTGGAFDGTLDFDEILRDPEHPTRLYSVFDDGDHIHLNDAGHQALGESVPLSLFQLENSAAARVESSLF